MKTPEQIASEVVGKLVTDNGAVRRVNKSIIYRWVEQAIEVDRAQRADSRTSPLFEGILGALHDRGSYGAEDRLRYVGEDTIWTNYLGPLLDELEDIYGGD